MMRFLVNSDMYRCLVDNEIVSRGDQKVLISDKIGECISADRWELKNENHDN